MLCLHLQIVYFPGQYQLREWRGGGEGAGIGMEVRIAVRRGDGGRMDAEVKRQFRHVVQAKCTCFLSLFTLRLLPRCLLSVVL